MNFRTHRRYNVIETRVSTKQQQNFNSILVRAVDPDSLNPDPDTNPDLAFQVNPDPDPWFGDQKLKKKKYS